MLTFRDLRPAVCLLLLLTLVLGFAYPLAVTGVGALVFARQASGSLIYEGNALVGSRLVGQDFMEPAHFWGRPSATAPEAYNSLASGASNLGPLNPALIDQVRQAALHLRAADPHNRADIPVELVSASASGLDPDISPAAARYQAGRVARARGLPLPRVLRLIDDHTHNKLFGIVGEAQINVLELNMALDKLR